MLRYVLDINNIWWFNLFSSWTFKQGNIKIGESYVQESVVDDTIIWLVVAHVSVGENEVIQAKRASTKVYKPTWPLWLFAASETLVQVDVLDLLQQDQDNIDELIDTHIAHIDHMLDDIVQQAADLDFEAQEFIDRSATCLDQKRDGDRVFFEGVEQNNDTKAKEWIETSLEFAPCYINNRIQANATAYLSQRVKTYYGILSQRKQLLEDNKELLVNHSGYLEGDILERLMNLKSQIRAMNTIQYQDVAWDLNFNVFSTEWDISALPSFHIDWYNLPDFSRLGLVW